jgi:hypothetical protein
MLLLGARFAAAQELSAEAAEELKPQVEAGARLLSDMSEEAQAYRRKELAKTVNPVMDPVPRKLKKQLYDQLSAVSGMSMRQLFNFMTAKKKVTEIRQGIKIANSGLKSSIRRPTIASQNCRISTRNAGSPVMALTSFQKWLCPTFLKLTSLALISMDSMTSSNPTAERHVGRGAGLPAQGISQNG